MFPVCLASGPHSSLPGPWRTCSHQRNLRGRLLRKNPRFAPRLPNHFSSSDFQEHSAWGEVPAVSLKQNALETRFRLQSSAPWKNRDHQLSLSWSLRPPLPVTRPSARKAPVASDPGRWPQPALCTAQGAFAGGAHSGDHPQGRRQQLDEGTGPGQAAGQGASPRRLRPLLPQPSALVTGPRTSPVPSTWGLAWRAGESSEAVRCVTTAGNGPSRVLSPRASERGRVWKQPPQARPVKRGSHRSSVGPTPVTDVLMKRDVWTQTRTGRRPRGDGGGDGVPLPQAQEPQRRQQTPRVWEGPRAGSLSRPHKAPAGKHLDLGLLAPKL